MEIQAVRARPTFLTLLTSLVLTVSVVSVASSQTFPTDDPVIRQMWRVGMEQSQTQQLAQVLIDSIGPRLAGGPALAGAQDWLLHTYQSWGVSAHKEQYGTWRGWRQGIVHVDMTSPRLTTLEAKLLAWSPGTDGPVEGEVVLPPRGLSADQLDRWLPTVRGKFLLISVPEPTCRAPHELEEWARPETVAHIEQERRDLRADMALRFAAFGGRRAVQRLDGSGAAGFITSSWSGGWGVDKVQEAPLESAVSVDLSCEDYGLLFRLAANNQHPRIRVDATSENLGVAPQFNVIAELPGTELPNEYVILSAHLDSWQSATGATDNGTGTIMMLEAMRILRETYPHPRRTILVAHWGDEEVGLVGSRSFGEDHPEIMDGVQAIWNQDNGTWRIDSIEGQGFLNAGEHITRWLSAVPTEITSHIHTDFPGEQHNTGSDHSSFVCRGVPAFRFQSPYPEYRQYTWHTNRDTYDKIVFDDLKENATLAAMVAYMASEDPERVPRQKAQLIDPRTGQPRAWPECRQARRKY